ncbi:MAG: hypothetical protein S4CHLAM20_14780 [Chlamydiia bacterium]|nr:hypothetical protein [Chlamydiia bacterium]
MATPTTINFSDMFSQGSTQLNFLLLSQRNMILIFAFALTFMVFANNFEHRHMVRVIMFCLLIYSVALGIVSIINYNNYISKTRKELNNEKADGELIDDELQILSDWGRWIYFSYALLGINGLIIIFYIVYEAGYYHNHLKAKRVRGSIN